MANRHPPLWNRSLMSSAIRTIFIIAAMTAITLLSFTFYPQYRTTGDQLLINHQFENGFSGWERSGEERHSNLVDNTLILSQEDDKYSTRVFQPIRGEELKGSYLLSGEMRPLNLKAGDKNWQRGGLVLARFDDAGKRIASYSVTSQEGTLGWATHEDIITIPAPTTHMAVIARLLESTGELHIRSVSLTPVEKQLWADTVKYALIAFWALALLTVIVVNIKDHGASVPLIILAGLSALALLGTLMPKEVVIDLDARIMLAIPESASQYIKTVFNTLFPGYIKHSNQEISKLGHWLIFALLSFFVITVFRKSHWLLITLSLLVLAAATETMQFLTPARHPHIYDFIIDGIGVLSGLIIALPIRFLTTQTTSFRE